MSTHLKRMKVVGGRNLPPYWERFDRLQRTANLLLGRPVSPRGIFRFKTYEEFEEWKRKLRQEHRNKPT
jgi:hypothetical protein